MSLLLLLADPELLLLQLLLLLSLSRDPLTSSGGGGGGGGGGCGFSAAKQGSVNTGQRSQEGTEKPPPTFCWTFCLPFPTIQLIVDVQQTPLQLQLLLGMELFFGPDHLLRCEREEQP